MSKAPNEASRVPHLLDLPARSLISQIADPSHNSGGGVAAGLTLAGAAASAELVLKLAARRKSLAASREQIEALLAKVQAHRASFEEAADRDIAAFTELVNAQREAKRLKESDPERVHARLQHAYVHAAGVPLALAQEALTFMKEVELGFQFASRFTISDLGAAAALARGAIAAALLTVDANLAYVEDDRAAPLRDEAKIIREQASKIADRVIGTSTSVITAKTKES